MAEEKNFDLPSVSQITVPVAGGKKNGHDVSTVAPAISNHLNSAQVMPLHLASNQMTSTDDTSDKDNISDDDDENQEDFALGLSDDEKTLTCEVFKEGTHVDSSGAKATWSDKDISEIVAKGNGQLKTKPIPITLGHPQHDSPAYGWVQELRKVGGKIVAKFNQLNGDFVAALKNGSYKGRSISLYEDNKIRHIGFLGSAQPAISGLQPFSFDDKSPSKTYDFDEEVPLADFTAKDVNFLYKLLSRFGLDIQKSKETVMADKIATPTPAPAFAETSGKTETIKQAEAGGQTAAPATANDAALKAKENNDPGPEAVAKIETAKAKAAESEEQTENADLKNQLAALISRIESLESALAKNHSEATATIAKATIETTEAKAKVEELKTEIVEQSVKQFVESLVHDGKLRPADVEMTRMALDAQIILDNTPTFNMSENKDEKKLSRLEQYKAKLVAMPKIVEFGSFPSLPAAQSPASFPAAVTAESMGSYIESKMCNKMAEQDKLGLTTKTSYWETMKGAHAEAAKEFPAEYKEYVSKTMMPGMPGR